MLFIHANVKEWLLNEVMESGNPLLFLSYIHHALDEIDVELWHNEDHRKLLQDYMKGAVEECGGG